MLRCGSNQRRKRRGSAQASKTSSGEASIRRGTLIWRSFWLGSFSGAAMVSLSFCSFGGTPRDRRGGRSRSVGSGRPSARRARAARDRGRCDARGRRGGCRMGVGGGRRASRWVARVLLYGGALALAAYLCRERLLAAGGEATAPAARPGPAASLLAVPASEMRSGLRTAYRLRPDARCLGAFSQVYAWLTGTGVLPVAATFVDGQWRLALDGTQIAALPELPDFDDCTQALRSSALGWTSARP